MWRGKVASGGINSAHRISWDAIALHKKKSEAKLTASDQCVLLHQHPNQPGQDD